MQIPCRKRQKPFVRHAVANAFGTAGTVAGKSWPLSASNQTSTAMDGAAMDTFACTLLLSADQGALGCLIRRAWPGTRRTWTARAAYCRVPLASALDLASQDRADGIQYPRGRVPGARLSSYSPL